MFYSFTWGILFVQKRRYAPCCREKLDLGNKLAILGAILADMARKCRAKSLMYMIMVEHKHCRTRSFVPRVNFVRIELSEINISPSNSRPVCSGSGGYLMKYFYTGKSYNEKHCSLILLYFL